MLTNIAQIINPIPATGIHARKNILKKKKRDKKLFKLKNDTFKAISIIGVKKCHFKHHQKNFKKGHNLGILC